VWPTFLNKFYSTLFKKIQTIWQGYFCISFLSKTSCFLFHWEHTSCFVHFPALCIPPNIFPRSACNVILWIADAFVKTIFSTRRQSFSVWYDLLQGGGGRNVWATNSTERAGLKPCFKGQCDCSSKRWFYKIPCTGIQGCLFSQSPLL